jgi:hypothetical protein
MIKSWWSLKTFDNPSFTTATIGISFPISKSRTDSFQSKGKGVLKELGKKDKRMIRRGEKDRSCLLR